MALGYPAPGYPVTHIICKSCQRRATWHGHHFVPHAQRRRLRCTECGQRGPDMLLGYHQDQPDGIGRH